MLRCYERGISPAYRKPHTCRQRCAAFDRSVTYSARSRRAPRAIRVRRTRTGLLVAVAAVAATLGYQSALSSSSPAPALNPVFRTPDRGALGEAGGAVPARTTVFD